MVDKISSGVAMYQQAMNLRVAKQNQIASNIANADTPNYLAKDLDFSAAMKSAAEAKSPTQSLQTTNSKHLSTEQISHNNINMQYRVPFKVSPDGNTVEVEHEKKEMVENALQYQFLTQLTTDYFNKLRTAMSSDRQ